VRFFHNIYPDGQAKQNKSVCFAIIALVRRLLQLYFGDDFPFFSTFLRHDFDVV